MKPLAILCCLATLLCGCATQPWERARPDCLDYANASCRAAQDAGYPAGIMAVQLKGTSQRHAVTWIIYDGQTLIWDAAWGCYRDPSDFSRIYRIKEGQSKGSYDYIPGPTTNSWPIQLGR